MPTYHPSTVLDYLAPSPSDSARQCLGRAALCSRLAKRAPGPCRKKLYRLKNENIRAASRCAPGRVHVHSDHDRYFGLLSVQIDGAHGLRVHTHENWIDAA